MKKQIAFVIILFLSINSFSQVPTVQDCLGAIPICDSIYVEPTPYLYSGEGNYPNEIYESDPANCIASENNGLWYIFTPAIDGVFRFTITANDTDTDYDWSMFDITDEGCDAIYENTETMVVSSNTWGDWSGNMPTGANSTISGGNAGNCNGPGTGNGPPFNDDIPVTAGDIYVLYVSNWSADTEGYTIDFSGSTAGVYDTIRPLMLDVNSEEYCDSTVISCHFNENILCNTIGPEDFWLFGPGGLEVVGVTSPACELGSQYGIDFEITLSAPLLGEPYVLYLDPEVLGASVIDNCGNSAKIGWADFTPVSAYDIAFDNTDITCHDGTDGTINASIPAPDNYIVEYTFQGTTNNTGFFPGLPEGTYTVTATTFIDETPPVPTGCDTEDETQIINPAQGFADAGKDSTICGFPNYQLEGIESPAGIGTWTCLTPEVTFDNENNYNATASIPYGIHTFTWTVDNGICGTFIDEVEISRYPSNTIAGNDDENCELSEYILDGNNPFPGTGIWTCETPEITFIDENIYNTTAQNIPDGSHIFTWHTDYENCGQLTDQVVITNYEIPTEIEIITESQDICTETIDLQANQPTIGIGQWITEGNANFTNQSNNNTTVTNLDVGENIFIWQIINGTCEPISEQVIINKLLPVTAAGNDKDICELITNLEGEEPTGGTGMWTTEGEALINEPSSPTTTVENLTVGENVFVWAVISENCPTAYDTVAVQTDNQAPITQPLPEITDECELTVNTIPTATDNCEGTIYATTSDVLYFSEQGIYTINWIYTDNNENQSSQIQTVRVEDITNPEIICKQDTTILLDTTNTSFIYTTNGTEFDFLQTNDNCIVTDISNNYNNSETVYFEEFELGTHILNWTVTDGNNNKKTCSTEIIIGIDPRDFRDCDEDGIPNYEDEDHCVIVPETFSPNGNGQNDQLIIEYIGLYPENKITIFNRWGNKVYEAAPYESNWNGTNMFGASLGNEKLPVGTYFYILYLDDTYEPLKGYIYLVK